MGVMSRLWGSNGESGISLRKKSFFVIKVLHFKSLRIIIIIMIIIFLCFFFF